MVIQAEMVASVHSVVARVGEHVDIGATVVILESMKMEIPVVTEVAGVIERINVQPGDVVQEGDVLAVLN
jgi:acetyl-CoA carboxylase biotin carboxyl carrier protein